MVWAHDSLLPELGRIFASLPNSDELIRVDRLDLELSSSDGGNWGPEVLGKLRSELISALMNRTRSARAAGAALVAVDAMDEDVSVGRGFLDTLAYYLETGVLPWSFAVTSQSAFDEAMQHWLTSSDVGRFRPHVAQLLQTGSVRSRFLASFSQAVLRKTLTVFFDVPEQVWEQAWLDSETLRLRLAEARAHRRARRMCLSIRNRSDCSLAWRSCLLPVKVLALFRRSCCVNSSTPWRPIPSSTASAPNSRP